MVLMSSTRYGGPPGTLTAELLLRPFEACTITCGWRYLGQSLLARADDVIE
jgi:hypothetical protein